MVRAGGGVDWNREWLLPRGVLASATARGARRPLPGLGRPRRARRLDFRAVPTAAVELRWPLVALDRAAPTT